MFRITETLATHGLGGWSEGGKIWNETNKIQTGKILKNKDENWFIVDVRDLIDGANPLYLYIEKVGMVRRAVEYVKNNSDHTGVVICCSAGQSRSNVIALAYLIDTGMSFEDAFKIVDKNPICNIDPSLLDDVKKIFPHTYLGKK